VSCCLLSESHLLLHTRSDHLILGLIFFRESYNTHRSGNKAGQVATLCKCTCITGSRYLLAFALWKPLSERLCACALHLTMEEKVQQHVCINFCFRLEKTGAETNEMLQAAFRQACPSRLKTFEWYSHYKSGRRSFEDDPCPGKLSTSHAEETVARVREIIHADRRLAIREVAEDVGIAFSMCQKILTEELQMRRVSAKCVPRLLTAEQKDDHMSICTDLCECPKQSQLHVLGNHW